MKRIHTFYLSLMAIVLLSACNKAEATLPKETAVTPAQHRDALEIKITPELAERIKNNLQLVEDHPLASMEPTTMDKSGGDSVFSESSTPLDGTSSVTSSGQLRREIDSVSLDWRSLRNINECVCSTPFDHFSKKVILPVFTVAFTVGLELHAHHGEFEHQTFLRLSLM